MTELQQKILAASISLQKISVLSGIDMPTIRAVVSGRIKKQQKLQDLERRILNVLPKPKAYDMIKKNQ